MPQGVLIKMFSSADDLSIALVIAKHLSLARVEQFLQLLEADNVLRQDRVGPFLVHLNTVDIRRITIAQTKAPRLSNDSV